MRRWGDSGKTISRLKAALGTSEIPMVQDLITELTLVVEQQCARCASQEGPLPGSSEAIESLIGKRKRLLGTSQNNNSLPNASSKNGFKLLKTSLHEGGSMAVWKEKLEYLREQEAIIADPAQKFALKKQIEEAERKIHELGGAS